MIDQAVAGVSEPRLASFRDPAGSLVHLKEKILRIVNSKGVDDLSAFLQSDAARKLLESGAVVATRVLNECESLELFSNPAAEKLFQAHSGQIVLEHERIAFPSFPYEWPPEMLCAAGELTLELAETLLPFGLGLKDGTPYNVLFRGPEPTFVDVLSFERRTPGDSRWLPYAQFVRTFLLPLLANKYYGLSLDRIMTTRRDGLEPEEVYRWTSPIQRLRPPFLSLVSLPTWLGRRHKADDNSIYHPKIVDDDAKARFILEHLFKRLRGILRRLKPVPNKSSTWSDYMATNSYTADHFSAKEEFVRSAVARFQPRSVLDVGCNTGHFSAIAAKSGASVVSIDYDPVVVGEVWRKARNENLNILPLVVNLTRPTPGVGWGNSECPSFLDRVRGKFDAVLMLAVIHHMLVTERVPLAEIIATAAGLTTNIAVIEFIAPADSMFRRLVRGREALHDGLNAAVFETACAPHFEVVQVQHLEGSTRWLYLLKKR